MRTLLIVAGLMLLVPAVASAAGSSCIPHASCWRPYAATSPFNRPIPADAPTAEGSARIVRKLSSWGQPQNLIAGGSWGRPLYFAKRTDPQFTVRCAQRWGTCEIEGHKIRIPDRALAARPRYPAGDAHMGVVQPDGWEYDFWQVRRKPRGGGTVLISWGGRTRIDGDGLDSNATAGLYGTAAGVVRAAELHAGKINHALTITVRCDAGRSVFPAVNHSGLACDQIGSSPRHAPPMGARLQLRMSASQIERLPNPRWHKTLLHAMANYGMIVGDTGGSSWALILQAGETFTSFGQPDPLIAFAKRNGWEPFFDVDNEGGRHVHVGKLAGAVNWQKHLRVVSPCVSRGDC